MGINPPPASDLAPEAPPRRRFGVSDMFIACFLLAQIALPLRYYLGGRGTDERFSWRMFSSQRVEQCAVDVDEVFLATHAIRAIA